MKKILVLTVSFCLSLGAFAQKTSDPRQKKEEKRKKIDVRIKQDEEGELYFKKQGAFGIRANSDGYGIYYEHGKFKSPRKINFYTIELNEKKHPKEDKQSPTSPYLGTRNIPFIFGKINNFYQFKLGYGQQKIFGGRSNKNGVSVAYVYNGGLSLGLLRPYTLEIADTILGDYRKITYEGADTTFFGNPFFITSGPSLGDGWKKLKMRPGVHARLGLRFDYGRFSETITALEVGLNAEYYFQKIPQMMYNKQKQFFFNFYATILFGSRK